MYTHIHIYIYIYIYIYRDIMNFPSELCRRGDCMFKEVARLLPPG